MADLDGYSVLSAIRRHPFTTAIPFIFPTAKVTMAGLRQGIELATDDYRAKPCSVEQLLAAIATRLERQTQLQACFSAAPLDSKTFRWRTITNETTKSQRMFKKSHPPLHSPPCPPTLGGSEVQSPPELGP